MVGPTTHVQALAPVLGRWRSSGQVLDEAGEVTAEISGTDIYTLLPGDCWIAHDVDVDMGDGQRVLTHELIGGRHPDGGWQMHSFDESDAPGQMRLTQEEPDLLLLHGTDVRSWFRIAAGHRQMSAAWERLVDGSWVAWMNMRFDREDTGPRTGG